MTSGRFKYLLGKFFITVVFSVLFAFSGKAQLVELNLSLKQDTIRIGERTELRLEIIKHQQIILQAFPLTDSLNKDIEVLDSLQSQSPDSLVLNLHLTSFKPGKYIVPHIPLVFSYENNTDTIFSPELLLTVLSPEINSQAEIRDIKPPLNLPFRLREILPETGITVGILLLIAILVFFILRRFRKNKVLEKAEKALPPHVIALKELDKLKEAKLWQNGKIKEYYSVLSDIIRVYLENRFNIPAMEYVSSETMESFGKSFRHEDLLTEMLGGILETSDMVKFAKADPLPLVNQGNMDNAYLFINQTKVEEISINEEIIAGIEEVNDNLKTPKV